MKSVWFDGFFTWGVNFDWLRSVILFCSLIQKKKSFLSVCVVSVKAQLHCSLHGLELLKITHISNGFFTRGVNFDWLRSVILFCSLIQKKKSFLSVCVVSVKAQLH